MKTKTFVTSVLAVAGLAILLIAPSLTNVGYAAPPTKDVLVVNTPAEPVPTRDVDSPARQPVNIHLEGNLAPGNGQSVCPTTLFTVPADKELVVEYVSLWAVSANVETPIISISRPGVQTEYLFFLEHKATSQIGHPLYGANQQTRLYFSPGDNVGYCVARDTNADDLGFRIRLSGYLVNVP